MDDSNIGSLIKELRKQKGYSQKELAEKLTITENDVLLWETSQEKPETTVNKHLSEILEVSIDELSIDKEISGKNLNGEKKEAVLNFFKYSWQMSKELIDIILILIGFGILLSPALRGTINTHYFFVYGAFFIMIAILRIIFRHRRINVSDRYKALYSFVLLSQLTAFILEMFEESLAIPFSNGPDKYIIHTFSYFSLTPPFAGAEFSPLLTGILTTVVLILSIIILINKGKSFKLRNADFICSILAFVFSILLFFRSAILYTYIPNYAIAILILLSAILQIVANRRIKSE